MIAKTPAGLFDYLFLAPSAAPAQAKLLTALSQTLPLTFLGMAAGILFAFALAIASVAKPVIVSGFMPVALVTQTMPLVALTPLLVLLLGRGPSVILWITVSVTFFPAFVTMAQGHGTGSACRTGCAPRLWRLHLDTNPSGIRARLPCPISSLPFALLYRALCLAS